MHTDLPQSQQIGDPRWSPKISYTAKRSTCGTIRNAIDLKAMLCKLWEKIREVVNEFTT